MNKVNNIGEIAGLFYFLGCIVTFGGLWLIKVVLHKAIYDAWREKR